LVEKLDGINNQIESNHAKLIQEELLRMQSRLQSEVARLELQLNKSKEIKDIWNALETKADLNNGPTTANKIISNFDQDHFAQEIRRLEVSRSGQAIILVVL
jgi:hypothetical protein